MTDQENATQVVQGDAFERLRELDDDSFHAAVVDYPWEQNIKNKQGKMEHRNTARALNEGARDVNSDDSMFGMESDDRMGDLLDELSRILVDGGWAVFFADDRFQDVVRGALRQSDLILRRNWAWTPESMGMGYYGRVDHYPMPVATNGETNRYVSDRSTLFRIPGGRDTDYPTGKPVDLYRQMLRPPVIEDGEALLEPFCGSAPGAAVAASRGLRYWGCDTDADAVELAEARFEQSDLGQWTQETLA